jgi:hypothetical protein
MLQPELKMRRDKIRVLMAQQNIEAALITCNVNLLYTYFLIKTIRDAKGNISMKELFDRTSAAVKRATALIDKIQEPQCMASPTWIGWEDIKLETPVVTP